MKNFNVNSVEDVAKIIKKFGPELDQIDEMVVFKGIVDEPLIETKLFCAMKDQGFSVDSRHFSVGGDLQDADWWSVIYDPNSPNAYAHSATPQPLHCDNAWFSDPAEINLFYMKKQSQEGGANTIISIDEICDDLERKNPSLLSDLKNITVKTKKGDSANERYGPIIDQVNGQLRIFWNYYRIERSNDQISNMVESFFNHLNDMDRRGLVKRNLANTGDIFFFNDSRVLHGRDAFSAKSYGDRILLQSMWRL